MMPFGKRRLSSAISEIAVATLDRAAIGQTLIVQQVNAPESAPEWQRWLEELGFIAGEQVTLKARGLPGGDPLVVRIGQSTFALRRAEAACIEVSAAAGHIGRTS